MEPVIEYLGGLLLVLLGGVLTVGGTFLFERWKLKARRREIAIALQEEIRSVDFDAANVAWEGFSDVAFEALLSDVPVLPEDTARHVYRFYFRVQHLQRLRDQRAFREGKAPYPGHEAERAWIAESETQRDALLTKLEKIAPPPQSERAGDL